MFEYIPEHSHQTFSVTIMIAGAMSVAGISRYDQGIEQESSRLLTETSTVITIEYHGDCTSSIVLDKGYCIGNSELRWYHGITALVLISR